MWTGRSTWKGSNNDIIRNMALHSFVCQCYSHVTSNVNRSQQLEVSNNDIIWKLALHSYVGQWYSQLTSNVKGLSSWKVSNNDIIGSLALYSFAGQCYSQVTSNLNRSQQLEGFKQRYNRKLSTVFLSWPVLLSGNVQSEQVAAAGRVQATL
jgi:hypothetical protein